MSSDQPTQTDLKHSSQNPCVEKAASEDLQDRERALIGLYQELTGQSEMQARSALMYVVSINEEVGAPPKA